ncbi:MAG: protein arginine phosphatase [Clostridiales bacterium]|jgi:protein-tyrosine-phosphatase|nr:protein arginine phosphatase [Clostridiales bacterium]MDK2932511.1 protein arginine phosphatase [Clostridiales bacterium]
MNKIKKILFVCTGNTCRSSMAEGLFKKMLEDNGIKDIEVTSAGTAVFFPSGASKHAVEVMKEKGIDLSVHQSKQINDEMIEQADLILTMTVNHQQQLLRICPQAADKIFTLKEFAYGIEDIDVPDISDPFGLPKEYYEQCAKEIYLSLVKVIEKIKSEKGE